MTSDRVYYVESPLGRGGFGTVYRARLVGRAGFSRAVALKVLNPDMVGVDEVARRLRDEARILGLVRHRAIVQVDSLVILDGRWTVVMELVEGVGLGHLIKTLGPLPAAVALEVAGETAGALHAAWSQPGPEGAPLHILHRDIKPSNLRITPLGEVKVLDFGIARADFGEREAKTRSVTFGTVDYMSPERLDMEDLPAGDIYALGAVLFEMLTGHVLGRTSANPEKHKRLLAEAVEILRAQLLPEELVALVQASLDGEPENRPVAREFERTCHRLRAICDSPTLRDWAESVVPPLVLEGEEMVTGDMSGASFMEQGAYEDGTNQVIDGPFSVPLPPAPPETEWMRLPVPHGTRMEETSKPRPAHSSTPTIAEQPLIKPQRWPLFVVVGAAVVLLGGVATLVVVRWLPAEPAMDTEPALPIESSANRTEPLPAPPEPTVIESDKAPSEPVVATVSPKEPAVRSSPMSSSRATPAPAAAPSSGVQVGLSGDAKSAVLLGPGGRHPIPGPVPPGSYRWEALFPTRGSLSGGPVVVVGSSTLSCTEAFARCALR